MGFFATTTFVALLAGAAPAFALAESASLDCARARGGVEKLICSDAALAALDRRLEDAYGEALARATGAAVGALQGEQHGWIRGRDDCSKEHDVRACVERHYADRIVRLQVAWQLVPTGPRATFTCAGEPAGTLVATFYETDPPAVRLERGAEHVLALQRPTLEGARYEGPNVTFSAKGEDAGLEWKGAKLTCRMTR